MEVDRIGDALVLIESFDLSSVFVSGLSVGLFIGSLAALINQVLEFFARLIHE